MGITSHFPVIIIIVPILTAVIVSITFEWRKRLAMPLAASALAASLLMSLALMPRVLQAGYISYEVGSWQPPFGIEIRIDFLGLFMMVLVAFVSLLTILYSKNYIHHELDEDKTPVYYSLLLLMSGAMLGFLATGDIFNMFVFIEIMSITSYALVAISGEGKAVKAAFKYLIMGAPSSILVLLGISFLYSVTGTLNMRDLSVQIAASEYHLVANAAFGVLVIGFAIKAALFPLHMWLPEAHSIAPSPVSAMLSGLFVKMGVFGIIRLTYFIYTINYSEDIITVAGFLSWVGTITIIYGSVMAIRQLDLKRMIAYSTIAQIGYIFTGIGLIEKSALAGSIYHILAHSLAKACFFMVAGSVIYMAGLRRITDLKGAAKKMPVTCTAFAIAAFSVVGVPPTAGFISKWYLITGSFNADNIVIGLVLLLGSVLTAIYCFRIIYYMFFLSPDESKWVRVKRDAPALMTGSTMLLGVLTLVFGIFAPSIIPLLEKVVSGLIS